MSLVTARRILSAGGSELDPALSPDRTPLGGGDLPEMELLVRSETGQHAACFFRGGPIFDANGRAEGAVLTFWDVTEHKRDAERRNLLMRELDHRVRNMLATIMAMIRISNEPRQSKEEFVTALSGRVGALARTHGILSEGRWEGATMGRLVDDEVCSASRSGQLVLEGDRDVLLPPKEAADLALALHELATNAMKHGAWSTPEGEVALRWENESLSGGRTLRVEWKEKGGPAISSQPERRGFGTRLLQGLFADGKGASLNYEPDGVHCTMWVSVNEGWHERAISESSPEEPATEAEAGSIAGLRVLVVEDEAVVRLDLAEMLRIAGAAVVGEAGSLAEGVEMAEAVAVEAAILDRNLNGESSLPLARLLAKRGIPIVFVSGYEAVGPGQAPMEEDLVHLQKPISPEALVSALAVVSRRRQN